MAWGMICQKKQRLSISMAQVAPAVSKNMQTIAMVAAAATGIVMTKYTATPTMMVAAVVRNINI